MFRFRDRRGFTLVEILVSIAIFGILTAVIFIDFSRERDQTAVRQAAEQIATDLQAAQNDAQAGVVIGATPPGAFGLSFALTSPTTYTLFADAIDGQSNAAVDEQDANEIQATRTLPKNVVITRITVSGAPAMQRMDVTFRTPDAYSRIRAMSGGAMGPYTTQATVKLRQTIQNLCAEVSIQPGLGTITRQPVAC